MLCETVIDALRRGHMHPALDLSGTTWCDTASLYTLVGIRHTVNRADGDLIINPSTAVGEALASTRLHALLPVFP